MYNVCTESFERILLFVNAKHLNHPYATANNQSATHAVWIRSDMNNVH